MKNKLLNFSKLFLLFCLFTNSGHAWSQQATDLFFSEYVEGSSTNKALEIYNGTGAPIDLGANGYVIQMYFNGSTTPGLTVNLTGTVSDKDVFVLAQQASTTNSKIIAQADQTSTASFFNGDDAIMLRRGGASGTILDVIGQIGNDPGSEWGSGVTSTADNTLRRKSSVLTGDMNGSDAFDPATQFDGFAIDSFDGLGTHEPDNNSTTPVLSVASVTKEEGNNGSTGYAFMVTLSKPAVTSVTFNIETKDGTAIAGTDYLAKALSAQTIPAGNTTYTFTVLVNGDSQPEADETFSVSLTNIIGANPGTVSATGTITNDDGGAITPVYTIQGSGTESPLAGQKITTTGIVVGDYQGSSSLNGFYIQDASGDNNAATSDGVFVYAPGSPEVSAGQLVQITGTVAEFNGQTQIDAITQITHLGRGTITPAILDLPVKSTGDLEQLEGMLVTFPEKLTVTQNFTLGRFGEVLLSADLDYPFSTADGRLYNPTNFIDPNDTPASEVENDETNQAAVTARQNLHNRASILLDDASTVQNPATVPYLGPENTLRVGSSVLNLTGVISYSFNTYRLQPTETPAFAYASRPLTPPAVGQTNVKIASFNVLNYFNGNGSGGKFPTPRGASTEAEFTRQRAKIIAAINGLNADVIGLLEMENDGDDALSAIADLVRGLNEATSSGTYDFIRDPASNGTGTDEIKVAFIYKPGVVTPVGAAIADLNTIHNRPPLAQTFRLNASGEVVTAVINHFKSKGGSGSGSNADQGDGQGNFNAMRVQQAQALADFIRTTVIPAAAGDTDVILLGDFNAYNEEDPLDVLREAGFINLFGPESYSYVFDGQSGSLDHALVTPSLQKQFTAGGKWHINADEPIFIDYNLEFKGSGRTPDLYQPNPFRSSDHDPVLVGLKLVTPTISFVNATASAEENDGTYTVNLSLSETTYQDATVSISVVNGAAGALYGTDYTTIPAATDQVFTLFVPAGSRSVAFTVNLLDDQQDELDEIIRFAISGVSGGIKLGNQASAALTIKDSDVPVISFTQSGSTQPEGSGPYTITLAASIAPVSDQTVIITLNDYDLEYGTKNDYVTNPDGTTGKLTILIPAGQTTASFTITPNKNVVKKKNSPDQIDFTISQVSTGASIGTPSTFVLAIEDKKESGVRLQVIVYPNPATTTTHIKVTNAGVGKATVTLYDQGGNLVLTKKLTTETTTLETFIDVSFLKRGKYIMLITAPQETFRSAVLLK